MVNMGAIAGFIVQLKTCLQIQGIYNQSNRYQKMRLASSQGKMVKQRVDLKLLFEEAPMSWGFILGSPEISQNAHAPLPFLCLF